MNKKRRKRIQYIRDQLMELQTEIEEIQNEEQESYDNLPDSLQGSVKGEKMQDNIDILNSVDSLLGDVLSSIDEVI